jgi:ribosomal protein S18 acetylase RimI-like enzyme
VNLVAAARFSPAELAELFTRAYEGYFVPMNVDEQTIRLMIDWWDIDLERSRVALEDGERVGVANLAIRGDRSWIGGIGVVPPARRGGVGRALMEAVIAEAPSTVTLEVLVQNEPAIRLYESLGFDSTRLLEVWSLEDPPLVEAKSVEPAPLGQDDLPWQRDDAALPEEYERLEVDGGAILLRGGTVLQLQADDEDAAVALLSRGKALTYANVPEGDVASGALARLGGELTLRQHEMRLLR